MHFIIISDVWPICHCLGLGHETMVCGVCLSIFSCYKQREITVLLRRSSRHSRFLHGRGLWGIQHFISMSLSSSYNYKSLVHLKSKPSIVFYRYLSINLSTFAPNFTLFWNRWTPGLEQQNNKYNFRFFYHLSQTTIPQNLTLRYIMLPPE